MMMCQWLFQSCVYMTHLFFQHPGESQVSKQTTKKEKRKKNEFL